MAQQLDMEGQQFGNYRLEKLLGEGGFAAVYLGYHIRLKRPAAIKILHMMRAEHEIESFEKEARMIALLNHPNIVRILEFDVQQRSGRNIPFLVMDYLPHGTLRQRHRRGERVALPTVISYVQQIASALQYAHDQRVIHRDIKPENLLVGQNHEIVLSDFGIAAIAHSTSSMTAQAVIGTAPYMAPEQIQAQARPASDQYALGVVVYEWLSGERPFEGSFTEIWAKHVMTPPPLLCPKVPGLAGEVEQVVLQALAKDPHQRFSTVRDFALALARAAQVRPPHSASTAVDPAFPGSSSAAEGEMSSLRVPSHIIATELVSEQAAAALVTDVANAQTAPASLLPQEAASHVSAPAAETITQAPASRETRRGYWIAMAVGFLASICSIIISTVFALSVNPYFSLLPPLIMSVLASFLTVRLGAVRRAGLLAGSIVSIGWFLLILFVNGVVVLALIWIIICCFLAWLTAWLMTRARSQA